MTDKVYPSYVKFIRGTPAAFDKLKVKNPDSMYFIRELDARVGDLYIGDTLIADGSLLTPKTISDLTDVDITEETIHDRSVLAYSWKDKKWVNMTFQEVEVGIMKGATETEAGESGLVPAPLSGQQDLYLKGDGTWADAEDKETKEKVEALTERVEANEASISSINSTIGDIQDLLNIHEAKIETITTTIEDMPNVYALKAHVGKIEDLIMSPGNIDHTLIGEVNDINRRITWNNY